MRQHNVVCFSSARKSIWKINSKMRYIRSEYMRMALERKAAAHQCCFFKLAENHMKMPLKYEAWTIHAVRLDIMKRRLIVTTVCECAERERELCRGSQKSGKFGFPIASCRLARVPLCVCHYVSLWAVFIADQDEKQRIRGLGDAWRQGNKKRCNLLLQR